MTHLPRRFKCHAVLMLLAAASLHVAAGDRPFLATNSAAAEEDDDAVWSVESWVQRIGPLRTLSIAPEYAFNPTTSVQFEVSRARDRMAGETEHEAEIEFKHLFNHIARDGYGWGVVVSLGFDKAQAAGWKRAGLGVNLPYTLSLWDGEGALHLNAGVRKPRDARREWTAAAVIERQVAKRTTLFAEAARAGDAKLLHVGVRWWIAKERFALDLALQRVRAGAASDSGVVIGIGWYDL